MPISLSILPTKLSMTMGTLYTSLELLKLIIEDPEYNYSYLSKRLGISTKTISIRFKKLQQAGIVERVGSDRKGYWKVIER